MDLEWGLAVNSVGHQEIGPGADYPPSNHPTRYLFSPERGRILSEYQLLYITEGSGVFSCETFGRDRKLPIHAGNMILLFPGEWHNYRPNRESGWKEYWIGFDGPMMDTRVSHGFFNRSRPILDVSFHDELTALYLRATEIAEMQQSGFQQALGGIVSALLGLAYHYDRNENFIESNTAKMVVRAKMLVNENLVTVTPTSLADELCVSYSSFRRIFKEYTGFSPAKYILNMKINKAKEMLTNSPAEIKEIAYNLGFDNSDYFFTVFRRLTGQTPLAYRTRTQGKRI